MLLDFLYGPRTTPQDTAEGPVWTRSVTIELDTVRDLIQIAGEWTNGGVRLLVLSDGRDPEKDVQLTDLHKLTEAQRRRLQIESQGATVELQHHRAAVDFQSPAVVVHPFDLALRDRLVATLLANGKPTVDPRRLRALRPLGVVPRDVVNG